MEQRELRGVVHAVGVADHQLVGARRRGRVPGRRRPGGDRGLLAFPGRPAGTVRRPGVPPRPPGVAGQSAAVGGEVGPSPPVPRAALLTRAAATKTRWGLTADNAEKNALTSYAAAH